MNKLQEMRKAKGLSQSQLSVLSSLPLRTLQHYESGYRSLYSASASTVLKLAKVLHCSVEDLLS